MVSCFGYLNRKHNSSSSSRHRQQPKPRSLPRLSPINRTARTDDSVVPSLHEEERARDHLRAFGFKELRSATGDFSRSLQIGEGGFGCVYRGLARPSDGRKKQGDGIAVAVKKLNQEGQQGHKQWLAEVRFLGVVEHPNLVKLIGYCAVDGERGYQRLLVYEFMPNKSLHDHLFNKAYPSLPWNVRLQIALGAAEGLNYLHVGMEVQVIYRDFKASNVLLDEEFKPKLSDFGLAREGPSSGNTHVSTAVMGTYGYAAPDYIETGHLTARSDVWSFGVVLYEILTGRKCTDRDRPMEEQKLLDWVKRYPVESSRFGLIMDPRLGNQYSMKAAREIASLATRCLSKRARERPSMGQVVESIEQAMEFRELDGFARNDDSTDRSDNYEQETNGTESFQRRMLHLAKLSEGADATGRRKFMQMKVADSS